MKKFIKKSRVLIETVFILIVILIVVCNFFLLNAFSEENNTFARNYVRATQLVQERIKAVLAIHEKKTDKVIKSGENFYRMTEVFDGSVVLPACIDLLDPTTNCGDFILSKCSLGNNNAETRCIVRNKTHYTDSSWRVKEDIAAFSQKIRLTDAGPQTKKVTVFIWWYNQLGLRKSVITRELKIQ